MESNSQSNSSSENDCCKNRTYCNEIHQQSYTESHTSTDESTFVSTSSNTTHAELRQNRRHNRTKRKSQHSLDYLKQHISKQMSIFESNGWFIPLPESMKNDKDGKGKVWSNRNYGADKKRQRKQNEKQMLETRIVQLERVLREEHGIVDLSGDESL